MSQISQIHLFIYLCLSHLLPLDFVLYSDGNESLFNGSLIVKVLLVLNVLYARLVDILLLLLMELNFLSLLFLLLLLQIFLSLLSFLLPWIQIVHLPIQRLSFDWYLGLPSHFLQLLLIVYAFEVFFSALLVKISVHVKISGQLLISLLLDDVDWVQWD